MTEQFRRDRQVKLAAVRRRPSELEATQNTARVAGGLGPSAVFRLPGFHG